MIQKVILNTSLPLLIMFMMASSPAASTVVEVTVDSLFVIASSGEVRYREMVDPAIDEIAAIGAPAVPILIEKFASRSPRERHTIRKIIQKIDSLAIPDLVAALGHSNEKIVQRVCWVLGDVGDSTAVTPLMAVTDHRRWQVRDQAVSALGKIGNRHGAPAVLGALEDSVGQVRKSAVVAAGRLTLNEAIPALIHRLGDDFFGARMSAIEALLSLDTSAVVASLIDSSDSGNHLVVNLGCRVLGHLNTGEAHDQLLHLAASDDPVRRAHAAVALVQADPDNTCGWKEIVLDAETDRLTRLKIESAIQSLTDEEE